MEEKDATCFEEDRCLTPGGLIQASLDLIANATEPYFPFGGGQEAKATNKLTTAGDALDNENIFYAGELMLEVAKMAECPQPNPLCDNLGKALELIASLLMM